MKTHPITGGMIEDGHGSHPEHVQAARHCDAEEAAGNVERADEWRGKLGLPTSVEREAAHEAAAEEANRHSLKSLHEKTDALHDKHDLLLEKVKALHDAIHSFLKKD